MGLFKCNCSKDIEELRDTIKKVAKDLVETQLETQRLSSHIISLRGLVNKKLIGEQPQEKVREGDIETEKEQPKTINTHYY